MRAVIVNVRNIGIAPDEATVPGFKMNAVFAVPPLRRN